MSNRKPLLVLLLLMIGLVVLNVVMRRNGNRAVDVPNALIDGDADYDAVVIAKKGASPVVLEKGDTWRLSRPYVARADGEKVLRLLDALAYTPISDLVSDDDLQKMGKTPADFALEDPGVRVEVRAGEKKTVVSFGMPTPSADGIYAAIEGESVVFVVPATVLDAVDVAPDSFRRRSLFVLEPDSILSFDIRQGSKPAVSFVRTEEGWTLRGGKRVSPAKVKRFVGELMTLKADTFVWPTGATNESDVVSASLLSGYGLDSDRAVTLTLKCADGIDRQLVFGSDADRNSVNALVHNGGAIVTLPSAARDFVIRGMAELADQRLFPLDKSSISMIRLKENGTECSLGKESDGTWFIETPIRALADATIVDSMLDRMLTLTDRDQVESGLSLSVSTSSVAVVVAHQRVLGNAEFESLRSKVMASFAATDVKRLVYMSGEKESRPVSVLYNRDRGVWNVEMASEGLRANDDGIAKILSALATLKAEKVVSLGVSNAELGKYGLDAPSFTLAVDQNSDGAVRRNVIVGGKAENGRYATIGSADAVFVISDELAETLNIPLAIK